MFIRPHHLLKATSLVLLLPYRVLTATSDDEDYIDFKLLGDDLNNAPRCQWKCLIECRKEEIRILNCDNDPTMDCSTNTCLCGNQERYDGALGRLQACAEDNCDYDGGVDEAKGLFVKYCDTYYKAKVSSTTRTSAIKTPAPTPSTDSNDDSNNNSDSDSDLDADSSTDETPNSSSSSSPNSSSSSDSDSKSGGGNGSSFGAAEIAGTVIGAVSAIAAIVGIFMQVRHKRKKANTGAGNRPPSGGNQEPPEVTQPMVHNNNNNLHNHNYNQQAYPPVGQNYGQQHMQPPANQSTGYLPQKYPMVTATPPPPDYNNYNQNPMDNGHMQQQHNPGYNDNGYQQYAPTPPPQQFYAPPPQQDQRYRGY